MKCKICKKNFDKLQYKQMCNKCYHREYYLKNRKYFKNYMDQYYEENADKLRKYSKIFRKNHKDRIKEYNSIYNKNHKEYHSEYQTRPEVKQKAKKYRKIYYERFKK